MSGTRFLLVDRDADLVAAWSAAFARHKLVTAEQRDYFASPAGIMVSPANSFGFMDGGLDLAIAHTLGSNMQRKVQGDIEAEFRGELPVGQCHITETGNASWPWLAVLPTMRVPSDIRGTLNVYHAFRALLLAISRQQALGKTVNTVLCPGLGTGIGCVSPTNCAGQMEAAYRQVLGPEKIPSAREVLQWHAELEKFI